MMLEPITVFLIVVASIAAAALLIYLTIQFKYPRIEENADFAPTEHLILSSEGINVYVSASPGQGQTPTYYLDIDDRIIIGMRDASAEQYAGIRCVIPQRVLQDLARIVLSDSTDEGTQA